MAKRGLRKAERRRWRGGAEAERSQTWCWMPVGLPSWESGRINGGAGKVILEANKGPGACHPNPVPGHARCRNGDWPLGTWSRCTNTRESFGHLLRRLQGVEQRRSVSESMSVVG